MYYEFKEPYYALIKGEWINHQDKAVEITAVKLYEDHIAELNGLTDSMKLRSAKGRGLYEDEAFHLFAKSMGDASFYEIKKLWGEIPRNSLVLIDNGLI